MEAIDLCMRNLRTEVDRLKKEKAALIQDNNDLYSRIRVLSEELRDINSGREVGDLRKRVKDLEQQLQIYELIQPSPGKVICGPDGNTSMEGFSRVPAEEGGQ